MGSQSESGTQADPAAWTEELSEVIANNVRRRLVPLEELEMARDYIQDEIHWRRYLGFWGATPEQRFTALIGLCDSMIYDWERWVTEEHTAMAYPEFLQSIYWEVIRSYIRSVRGLRCELCNRTGPLDTHHKTYQHRGSEHRHLEDLILLCRTCHEKFHDKIGEGA